MSLDLSTHYLFIIVIIIAFQMTHSPFLKSLNMLVHCHSIQQPCCLNSCQFAYLHGWTLPSIELTYHLPPAFNSNGHASYLADNFKSSMNLASQFHSQTIILEHPNSNNTVIQPDPQSTSMNPSILSLSLTPVELYLSKKNPHTLHLEFVMQQ